MNINDLDLITFANEASDLIGPHVTRLDDLRRWDASILGTAFMTQEQKAALTPRIVVELTAKTFRAESGFGGCDGTAFPSGAAMEAAEALAQKYGLKVKWEPCEKGWGSFWFERA